MAHRLFTMFTMFCTAVSFTAVGALPIAERGMGNSLPYARSFDGDGEVKLFARATWGKGKYTVDLDTYHRDLKPKILTQFQGMGSFTSLCGTNPDFEVSTKGEVWPSATKKKDGKCSKSKFSLDLGALILSYVERSPSPDPSSRSPSPAPHARSFEDDEEIELVARATWGKGKYTVDLDTYHRGLKPKILSEFKSMGSFTSLCGTNPDFEVDNGGTVWPSATKNKDGKCSKSKFSKDLGALILSFVERPPSPEPQTKA